MRRTLVLDVVGLTPGLLGENTPNLNRLISAGAMRPLATVTPAVTATVQSTLLTGLPPSGHGCVGNGWYFRDLAEVWFWRQSNHLVGGEKVWEDARRRDSTFTCAKLFWWYNMYASADYTVTPRPMYPADGRKLPDVYTQPASLRDRLNDKLGTFPLFNFWGPTADIVSSRWIVECARYVYDQHHPTLTLVYLPHLDYSLQRLGPDHGGVGAEVAAIDQLCGELIEHVEKDGTRVVVLSEYGITAVTASVSINRVLRRNGLVAVRDQLGQELLDAGASAAFAVADHQVAHVYVADHERVDEVRQLLESTEGIETVLDREGKRAMGLDHPRSGELVCLSQSDRWFDYYYWLDDERAPDYARTVDIHRKPGYDPAELFLDARLKAPKMSVGWRLLKKSLGLRTLMDVIGLDPSVVRGSHGRITDDANDGPLIISSQADLLPQHSVDAGDVKRLLLDHVFGRDSGSRDNSLK